MTSSAAAPAPKKRNPALVVLDVAAGIVFIVLSLVIGIGVLLSAVQYGGIQAQCGTGPYDGITCNSTVLAIVVYGLMAVAVLVFFLGVGFFLVSMVRKRYGFFWPLGAIIVTVVLFYVGSWVAGMTVPVSESRYALGVDLGGTKIEAALVDPNGTLLAGSRFRAPTGRESSSAQLAESAARVVTQAVAMLPDGATLVGAGIGSAGPIDVAHGLVSPLNLPAWRGYPLRQQVADLVPGLPVTLRMDGECITIAEHWIGAGQGEDNLMGMVVSTGIGGGLILGGSSVAGPTGNAGHIGHIEVGSFDEPCLCGGTGCVEAVASGPNTVAWARKQGWAGTTGEDLARDYAAGVPIAIEAVKRSGRAIGQAIASATSLVDLEFVAIGGGFSHVTPDLFDFVREAIAKRAPFPFVAKVRVIPSALSGEGPLIGAAALIHRSAVVS